MENNPDRDKNYEAYFLDELDEMESRNYEDAGKGKRFLNYIIDFIGMMILGFILGVVLGLVGLGDVIESINNYIVGFILILIYYPLLEGTTGRSLGKLITGTKVTMEDGSEPDFGTIMKRTFCRLIPFEGFTFLGDNPGLHDRISNTRVVLVKKNY